MRQFDVCTGKLPIRSCVCFESYEGYILGLLNGAGIVSNLSGRTISGEKLHNLISQARAVSYDVWPTTGVVLREVFSKRYIARVGHELLSNATGTSFEEEHVLGVSLHRKEGVVKRSGDNRFHKSFSSDLKGQRNAVRLKSHGLRTLQQQVDAQRNGQVHKCKRRCVFLSTKSLNTFHEPVERGGGPHPRPALLVAGEGSCRCTVLFVVSSIYKTTYTNISPLLRRGEG